jgi:thiol-disulfide isomerase/thioredoxin
MTQIKWEKDWDRALVRAREEGKMALVDFFNPNCIGCRQMGALTYPDPAVTQFLADQVVPLQIMFDHQTLASKFAVKWTPTLVVTDAKGVEHHRTVGFLGPEEFVPSMMLGIGKAHFDLEQFPEAVSFLESLMSRFPGSASTPEAIFYLGVARFKHTNNPAPLKEAYDRLSRDFPDAEWTKRAYPYRLLGS